MTVSLCGEHLSWEPGIAGSGFPGEPARSLQETQHWGEAQFGGTLCGSGSLPKAANRQSNGLPLTHLHSPKLAASDPLSRQTHMVNALQRHHTTGLGIPSGFTSLMLSPSRHSPFLHLSPGTSDVSRMRQLLSWGVWEPHFLVWLLQIHTGRTGVSKSFAESSPRMKPPCWLFWRPGDFPAPTQV